MTAYFAAFLIVAAVALFVAAPLTEGFLRRKRSANLEFIRLQHERELALQGLRELEFDHEMGKLDESDYQGLKANLENHALAAMRGLEQLAQASRPTLVRLASIRSGGASTNQVGLRPFNFCPQCGSRAVAGYRFCPGCGTALVPAPRDRAQA
jgi:NADH pyrophosphatase NudC (nudix superfamily)